MKKTMKKIFEKLKKFNNDLLIPSDCILVDAIMEHLDRNPYTSLELNKLLNINDESKVKNMLEEMTKSDIIRKTDFRIEIDGHAVPSPLYFSLSFENKFLDTICEKGMTVPDLYQELGCSDEFKIMAILGTLAEENKVQIDELPDGVKTICRDEVINLIKYKKTRSS